MPELPEVETIRSQLSKKIIGKKWQGKTIVSVRRRAKMLIIDFNDSSSLVFHLKLTGQLIFNARPSRYTRKVFDFSDGTRLVFNNMRRFGWWKLVKSTQDLEDKLGPEPLGLKLQDFKKILFKRPGSRTKMLLMDQKAIAGIGNIYSDEILFASFIRPDRRTGSLTEREIKSIFHNIKKILKQAVKARGSSNQHYLDGLGKKGDYVKYQKVYRRTGLPCPRCGAEIQRIKLGGRSAHLCPKCQK